MTFDIVLFIATLAPLALGLIAIAAYTYTVREAQASARFALTAYQIEDARVNVDPVSAVLNVQIAFVCAAIIVILVWGGVEAIGLAGLFIFPSGGVLKADYITGKDRLDPGAILAVAGRKSIAKLEKLRRSVGTLMLDENRTQDEIDEVWSTACLQASSADLLDGVRARIEVFAYPLFHVDSRGNVSVDTKRAIALYDRDKDLFYQAFRLGHWGANDLAPAQSIVHIWSERGANPEEIDEDCVEALNTITARVARALHDC